MSVHSVILPSPESYGGAARSGQGAGSGAGIGSYPFAWLPFFPSLLVSSDLFPSPCSVMWWSPEDEDNGVPPWPGLQVPLLYTPWGGKAGVI
ncbi:hypothetical protein E2C01_017856 [Portunus trituberculatus]|uniref:Uncharacterized protein n=1 Tax=Portunus trituberculatus TaxID=210409 RepID=A0A5B7DSW8_PORTR|nr:hypothetical protein [Portunus trituberculatus]